MSENPWIENTGTVPDGVTADTVIEVEYRCGEKLVWQDVSANTDDDLWTLENYYFDVIRWRFI